MYFLRISI
jgi:hypothetical protein